VVSVVDLAAALDAANHGTSRAIFSRARVTPDIDAGSGRPDTPASGQPVSLAVDQDRGLAYVVNHSGRATPAEAAAFQHGHPGSVAVLDLAKALDPARAGTTDAIARIIPTGTAGPVGIAWTPDRRLLLVASAEAPGCEDGGETISVIDPAAGRVIRQIFLRVDPLPTGERPEPCRRPGPHQDFGRYPNTNGIAVSALGGGTLFTANGGTDDVSVVSLPRALAGEPGAELCRVPVETGPFGIAVSPDGRLVAVASRESARTGREGNTISLIDAERGIAGDGGAERARIPVGTDDAATPTRPFAVAFTPDGRHVIASCFRTNTVSRVDVAAALAGRPAEEKRLHLVTSDGRPGRPRGIAVTADGRHAAITGGAREGPGSSVLFLVEIAGMTEAGCVTGVGDESYFLAMLERP